MGILGFPDLKNCVLGTATLCFLPPNQIVLCQDLKGIFHKYRSEVVLHQPVVVCHLFMFHQTKLVQFSLLYRLEAEGCE
jgi:hypothetical protein